MSGPLGASTSLSGKYAEAAAYSVRHAWVIQEEASASPPELRSELEHHYRLYCTAAVYNTVLFLEAAIHEFFAAVAIASPRLQRDFSEAEHSRLEGYWNSHAGAFPPAGSPHVVDRYNEALSATGNDPFIQETHPARGVLCLLAFSRSFGQTSSEQQQECAQSERTSLEEELGEAGFPLNPFHKGGPFPDLYLGHGCAEWAINTAIAFYGEFCSRMGIRNELDSPIVSLHTRE